MTAPLPVIEHGHGGTAARSATVILVGGHESNGARDLAEAVPPRAPYGMVAAGMPLTEAIGAALAGSEGPVCVVPMTLGRDRTLVAEAARALRWADGLSGFDTGRTPGRVALSAPFGTQDHLVGWLRAAAERVPAPPGTAVLVTAPAADPFADAELYRVARLVRQYGRYPWVEVAFSGGDPDVEQGVDRCRRLGAERVLLLPAGFGPAARTGSPTIDGGPLLSPAALEGVLAVRCAEALHRLSHGDDGIAAGLDAEHGHGFAHSHGPDHSHSDEHEHEHPHSH